MKKSSKIVTTAILVITLVTLTALPLVAFEIKRYYGDINNDAYVTTQDAILALSIATKIREHDSSGMEFDAVDVDFDGKTTTNDARLILKLAAGQSEKTLMQGYEFNENADKFVKAVNEKRIAANSSNGNLKLSTQLCTAAKEAAEEYATKTGSALARSDGSYYYKLLNDKGISYNMADKIIIPSSYNYKATITSLFDELQSKKALCNKQFKKIGVGAYSSDGHTFYWCIFLTD